MLRNNLAKLMIDRSISATQLFNDTGIARSTISKISNNATDKISMQLIDKLCLYLNITPAEFFDYVPYEIDIKISLDDYDNYDELTKKYLEYNHKNIEHFEVILNIKNKGKINTIIFDGTITADSTEGFLHLYNTNFNLSVNNTENILKTLPIQFQIEILQQIKNELIDFARLIPFGELEDIGIEVFGS